MSYSGKKKYYIPKGSEIWDGSKLLAVTNKDFHLGYLPTPLDFTPNLRFGQVIEDEKFIFRGKVIYRHPDFTKDAPTKEY